MPVEETLHWIAEPSITLRACVKRFAQHHAGIVVFADDQGRFAGLLTAGDVFRLLAHGASLEDPVSPHINTKAITVAPDATSAEILNVMTERGITVVPVVRADGSVQRIVTQAALLKENILRNRAVIMAGGDGIRLRPLTAELPKALVEVNGRPILQILIDRLRQFGIADITICVRYRAEEIRRAIGDGAGSHINITYVEEAEPLGTAGALGLIPGRWDEPFFVLNCDVLTDIDLRHMQRFHAMNGSQLTVAVKDHEVEVPFGVVEVDHERVVRLSEKPKMKFYVNAGIYLLDPSVKDSIVPGKRCDLTDVINGLLESGQKVCSFPIRTFWYDVGDRETLARVQALEL